MSEHHDIYVRAHTIRMEKQRESVRQNGEVKWSNYALVFDCESRITADQTLTFGFWRFCELRNGEYFPLEEGIFHDDTALSAKEFNLLRKYARSTKPDTTDDGCDRLRLYSRSKFVSEVFGIAIQAKALIVCFNAGFDLSRLALDWATANNGGWSLILSQWRNPKTGALKANKFFPRVVVKALNSKTAIIHSTRAPMSEPGEESKKAEALACRAIPGRAYSALGASQQIVFVKEGMQGIRRSWQAGPQAERPGEFGRN